MFFSYKYAAIQLIKQGKGGRIIGAASIAGKKGTRRVYSAEVFTFIRSPRCDIFPSSTFSGFPQHAVYTATKFAVRGMTQCAAIDYGKYGITVNAYAPGAIETALRAYIESVPSTHSP